MKILTTAGLVDLGDLTPEHAAFAPVFDPETGEPTVCAAPLQAGAASPRSSVSIAGMAIPSDALVYLPGGGTQRADSLRAGDTILAWLDGGAPGDLVLSEPQRGAEQDWPQVKGAVMSLGTDGTVIAWRF